ncbi:hypothetical protein, partial [Borborobacter arsenicus]|uniref:hypothetical protein n=1 Tax=Borborobacter arsenicus TaxID=1851146 RepID=UPI001AECE39A
AGDQCPFLVRQPNPFAQSCLQMEALNQNRIPQSTFVHERYSLYSPGYRKFAPRYDYNALHVSQLLWLYDVAGDPIFLEWASRFQAYELTNYSYSAKGSVDPVKHGPDGAAGHYGNAYWSHADFPTWIQVDAPGEVYSGLAIHGNGDKAIPRDFTVSAVTDIGWKVLATVKGNTSKIYQAEFEPIYTTAFRVDIESDNGNRNVALQAVMPIPAWPAFAPVSDECNYRMGKGDYNYDLAIDGNPETAMRVYCDGWLVLPIGSATSISIKARAGKALRLSFSDDLQKWRSGGTVAVNGEKATIPGAKFVRLEFGADVGRIEEVSLN